MPKQEPFPAASADAAICLQPHCALRKEGVGADQLADVILAVMTGNEPPPVMESGTITERDLCRDCVRSIFEGRRMPLTQEEAEENAQRVAKRIERRVHRSRRRA